jgi:hypothetical protein
MRRCELAGTRNDLLELEAGTLALDPFTLAALSEHVEMLDQEWKEFGLDYQDHGLLFCWENGSLRTRTPSRAGSRSWPQRPVCSKNRPARRPAQLRHRWP